MDSYVGVISYRFISLKNNLNGVILKVVPCLFENDAAVISELGGFKDIYVLCVNIVKLFNNSVYRCSFT